MAAAETDTAQPKLWLDHVGKVFERDGKTVPVLEDLNLEVGDGEFVCLVGPSGSAALLSPQVARS